MSGSGDGGDNSIQFINIERVGDKRFKEWRRKVGGGRVGDNIIFYFFYAAGSTKKSHFKKLHFGQLFLFVFVKFCNS